MHQEQNFADTSTTLCVCNIFETSTKLLLCATDREGRLVDNGISGRVKESICLACYSHVNW